MDDKDSDAGFQPVQTSSVPIIVRQQGDGEDDEVCPWLKCRQKKCRVPLKSAKYIILNVLMPPYISCKNVCMYVHVCLLEYAFLNATAVDKSLVVLII